MAQKEPGQILLIGAGLPRTGTSSLKIAFEKLLGGQCYHMTSFIMEGTDFDQKHWTKALRGQTNSQDWIQFFQKRDCISCVDFPPAYFFKEIVRAFPDAKVVLSTRNPDTWHESVEESVMRTQRILRSFPASLVVAQKPGMTESLNTAYALSTTPPQGFAHSLFSSIEAGKSESKRFYDDWISEVKQVVPKGQLLEFEVKQGWEPLCQFLGLPVPDQPFPRANDRQTMAKTINKLRFIGWSMVLGAPLVLGIFVYGGIYLYHHYNQTV
ncbi:uncharacterized protein LOC131888530 [Tigriopus californicus]|uniref:uncharacterized protein LOC131888530 n=1 Tax=Tigriopus californicus TaxID=6832 RepID=UPI0027DA0F65|nr:uncharacterized protein LOC131888530 [Tigriopus californicus]